METHVLLSDLSMKKNNSPFLVTVCLQTFQQAPYIRQAVESVLAQQTSFPVEILIGEDDSTDGTREICQQLAAAFPDRIRLFLRSEKDKIYIDGLKTGRHNFISNLKAAKGKYIALLDGDDYWTDPLKLQKQVEALEKDTGATICFCGVMIVQHGSLHPYKAVDGKKHTFTAADLALNCFIQTCAVLFRNPGFETIPSHFYQTPVLDYALYLHLASSGKILYLKEPMAVYRFHAQGFWTLIQKEAQIRKLWLFADRVIPSYSGPVRTNLERQRKRLILRLVRQHIRNQEYDKIRPLLAEIEERCPQEKPGTIYLGLTKLRYQLKRLFK